jgi:hypothetical protein
MKNLELSSTSINILGKFNQFLGIFNTKIKHSCSGLRIGFDFPYITIERQVIRLLAHS